MTDYAGVATQYARDVVSGEIPSCRWQRLACERHLRDLERDAASWRYTWNPEIQAPDELDAHGRVQNPGKVYRPADRACFFVELMPHVKGDWAARRERLLLGAWQIFVIASIFGWVDRETNKRRFRVADLFVPRKNAKSTMAAAIGLYMLTADNEYGAEVYSGATTEDQAGEVFEPAKRMAEATPEFCQRFGVVVRASNISVAAKNSKFEPIIGKPGDGASPSCGIVDEYHEHPSEDLYDTIKTGMLARSQPLLLMITTAGDDVSGPCYAHQEELQSILEGTIEDERRFGIIFGIDIVTEREGAIGQTGDDWTTEAALIKANPNYGVSIDRDTMLADQAEALRNPRKQATFQTKHLNMWVGSSSPWLNLLEWRALGDKSLSIDQFRGEPVWPGLDLANVVDIAGYCKVFRRELAGLDHYYAFWRFYLPEARIDDPENKHYQGWKREGYITATPGNMLDQALIEQDILADQALFRMSEIGIDAWGAPGISANMQNAGLTVIAVPQNVAHLSGPMKFIDGLVQSKRLHHCGDPVATWGVSNVSVKPDRNENWFPRRTAKKKKIDPALMLIIAMSRAMLANEAQGTLDGWLNSGPPGHDAVERERLAAGLAVAG